MHRQGVRVIKKKERSSRTNYAALVHAGAARFIMPVFNTGVLRSFKNAFPECRTAGLCLGPYDSPMAVAFSYERGTPVLRPPAGCLGQVGSGEKCSGFEACSYLRLIDSCITQLKGQGPARTCNESKEEEANSLCEARQASETTAY